MSDFVFAIVTIVYALVCLPKEADQGKCATSKSAEDGSERGAEGKFQTITLVMRKSLI